MVKVNLSKVKEVKIEDLTDECLIGVIVNTDRAKIVKIDVGHYVLVVIRETNSYWSKVNYASIKEILELELVTEAYSFYSSDMFVDWLIEKI